MSAAPEGLHACPDIQAELDNYFSTCDASLLPDPAPLNEFLWSPLNRSGVQQLFTPSENKIRTVILRYDQRLLESDVEEVDSCTPVCVATTKRGDLTQEYTIDTCDKLRVEELMTANDFKAACRGNFDIINKKMMMMLNALRQKVATKITGLAVAQTGYWPSIIGTQNIIADGANNAIKVNTLKAGTTDINPKAMFDVDFALKVANFCNGAAIFSGRLFYEYSSLMNTGCCSNQGLDLSQIFAKFGYASMWDRRLQVQMGQDYALAIAPRALQPVFYTSHNNGLWGAVGLSVGGDYQKQVIYDPQTGMGIDLTLSDKCGALSIIMETVVDLKALPQDLFAPTDYMNGVTWVGKIRVINT